MIPTDMVTGTRHTTRQCGELEIVEYSNKANVRVRFVNTGYETIAQSGDIRIGCVKDKLSPSVFGVGYVGDGEFKTKIADKHTKIYQTWSSMLRRCYDKKYQARQPTYIGCSVCDEWHNFQVFAEWMSKQDYEGKHLDKDIRTKGNKVYSPDNCMFVMQAENTADAHAKHYTFTSPDGAKVAVYNLSEFCREKNLDVSMMSKVHLGKAKQHKKWTAAEAN